MPSLETDQSRPNVTSAFAPQPVRVTLHNFHNVYVYSAAKLWIAYGLSVLFTLIATAIGLQALITEAASYRSNLSTVFRIARGAFVSVDMDEDDLDGADPMQPHMTKAKVRLSPTFVSKEGRQMRELEQEQSTGTNRPLGVS